MPYHIYIMMLEILRPNSQPTTEQLGEAREAFVAWGKTATDLGDD